MKTPKYTDDRYPNGYRASAQTDIRKTFARVRAEQKAKAEETERKAAEALAVEKRNAAEAERVVAPILPRIKAKLA